MPERSKKPSNSDLPAGVDQKLWRSAFISTYMQFVATQPNPWEVPAKLACEKMQLIWDAIFPDIEYTVTVTSAVYLLVSMLSDTVRFIDNFCRLSSGLLTHGVVPLGRPHFRLCSHTLMLKITYGILTRIG